MADPRELLELGPREAALFDLGQITQATLDGDQDPRDRSPLAQLAAARAASQPTVDLRSQLAEHESNQRAYEEIIGKKTYREVADELARMKKALEIARDAIDFYGLDDFEETTQRTLKDIDSALQGDQQ